MIIIDMSGALQVNVEQLKFNGFYIMETLDSDLLFILTLKYMACKYMMVSSLVQRSNFFFLKYSRVKVKDKSICRYVTEVTETTRLEEYFV